MTNVTANDQKSNVPALPSTANISSYLDEHCGGGSGVLFKFAKDQRFRRIDDGEEIPLGTEFTVIYDQIQVGWIRFYGKGMPPERKMGPLFEGFSPPPRDTLGETDPSVWEKGLIRVIDECTKMLRREPDQYPVVKLALGSFQHRDDRVGRVTVPAFVRVGKTPKTGTAKIDTSIEADLNDEIPWK
jgi:hypothetical protein